MTETFREQMKREADSLGISLDEQKLSKLYSYYEMIVETNKVMNLTTVTEESEAITRHFTDSLEIVRLPGMKEKLEKGISIIDVGTGAGLPGMVLKIVFPNVRMTLFDSLNKRINFLNSVIEALGLTGIETVHGRAEDFGRNKEFREKFDLSTARAVANMSTLAEYCMPFAKVGGQFIAYKTAEYEKELSEAAHAIETLGGTVGACTVYTLPSSDVGFSLISIDKTGHTPRQYPRKAGTPSKEPLK